MTEASPRPPATLPDTLAADLVAHRAGDPDALTRIVTRATPLLWHVARSCGVSQVVAEDAVQNTFLALFRHADRIDDARAVLKWLIVTVRREAVRLDRVGARTTYSAEPDADIPSPQRAEPEQVLLDGELKDSLWRAISALPRRCQQLLRIIAFADRPDYEMISATLGMKVGSIGPTRGRCLQKLRALLAADAAWSGP